MQYIYSEYAGNHEIILNGDLYKYIVKVRRFKEVDKLSFRNLTDEFLYIYKIVTINKKDVILLLQNSIKDERKSKKEFELFWCVVDTKTIEKTLPMLNQIGVTKITFLYCDRSQKNFKIDLDRLKKIVINSNQQCGRVDIMKFNFADSIEMILNQNKDIYILDFGGEVKYNKDSINRVLIGCEGGFSDRERELFSKYKKISFETENILKSETAAISIASKILL